VLVDTPADRTAFLDDPQDGEFDDFLEDLEER
jgi:hypothetical protein